MPSEYSRSCRAFSYAHLICDARSRFPSPFRLITLQLLPRPVESLLVHCSSQHKDGRYDRSLRRRASLRTFFLAAQFPRSRAALCSRYFSCAKAGPPQTGSSDEQCAERTTRFSLVLVGSPSIRSSLSLSSLPQLSTKSSTAIQDGGHLFTMSTTPSASQLSTLAPSLKQFIRSVALSFAQTYVQPFDNIPVTPLLTGWGALIFTLGDNDDDGMVRKILESKVQDLVSKFPLFSSHRELH
jgi:hypothetical protein